MKLKTFVAILLIGFTFISSKTYSQIDSTRLLKSNRVKSLELYSRQIKNNGKVKKKRNLISIVEFNNKGMPIVEIYYGSNGKEDFRHLYYYNSDDKIDSIKYIKKNDTIITKYTESINQIKIITGRIPDYFPKYEFYKNGLLKSETVILRSTKESFFEYVYEYY